jgi:ESF2/ABP1 family protein
MDNDDASTRKRKRLDDNELAHSSPEILEDQEESAEYYDVLEDPNEDEHDEESTELLPSRKLNPSKKKNKVLASRSLTASREAIAKTGVIYLSRIPPRLTPTKLRQLLAPYGSPILRVFFTPESPAEHTRRIKSGGSHRKKFLEGWVEFEDKKVAKKVAGMLNAERIGNKKGDLLYDDLWNLKYLSGFKWHHLTEEKGMLG